MPCSFSWCWFKFSVISWSLSLLPVQFLPKCNHLICWWWWLPPTNFLVIHSVFLWSERKPMAPERKQDRHWGCGTDGRIMGRGKNTMTVCSIKTVQRHVFIRRHNNNKLTSLGVSGNYGTKATLYRNFKLFVLILTCSVSAKFATCPKSLTPRTLNRVPARSQLSRDIRHAFACRWDT